VFTNKHLKISGNVFANSIRFKASCKEIREGVLVIYIVAHLRLVKLQQLVVVCMIGKPGKFGVSLSIASLCVFHSCVSHISYDTF